MSLSMEISLEDGRDVRGETVMGMRVAAYRQPIQKPVEVSQAEWESVFPNGAGNTYSEHWSTPVGTAERLFTEDDVRALLAKHGVTL